MIFWPVGMCSLSKKLAYTPWSDAVGLRCLPGGGNTRQGTTLCIGPWINMSSIRLELSTGAQPFSSAASSSHETKKNWQLRSMEALGSPRDWLYSLAFTDSSYKEKHKLIPKDHGVGYFGVWDSNSKVITSWAKSNVLSNLPKFYRSARQKEKYCIRKENQDACPSLPWFQVNRASQSLSRQNEANLGWLNIQCDLSPFLPSLTAHVHARLKHTGSAFPPSTYPNQSCCKAWRTTKDIKAWYSTQVPQIMCKLLKFIQK